MKYLIFLFLFIYLKTYSQNNTIYVEYGVVLEDDGSFTKDKMFANDFLNAMKAAENLTFGLVVNKKGSKFFQVDNGIEYTFEMEAAKSFASYLGAIYSLENQKIRKSDLLGKDIYVKIDKINNWIITEEKKEIDNFTCFKATNTYTVVNPKGTFNFPVTAWFCPKLPYNFGPLGYDNLPGLILELKVRHTTYFLKKVDLKSLLDFDIEFLKKAQILTEKELNKKLDEFNNFDKN